jgi:hypothetical protein
VLANDGSPMPNNPLDPEDGRRQAERANARMQKVRSALAATPPAAAPSPTALADLQARALQMQARCGTDRDCLMREATALSAAQVAQRGGGPATQARLQAYGDAVRGCERSAAAGAAREACISQARRAAGGGDDGGSGDDTVEAPYLLFTSPGRCGLDVQVHIDERLEGSFDDVQGRVPFTQTRQADQRRLNDTACPLLQAVLDTRNGRLWTNIAMATSEVDVVTVRSERGRAPQRQQGPAPLRWHEAEDWLAARLLALDAAGGEAVQRLPLAAGGSLTLRLRWRFDPA